MLIVTKMHTCDTDIQWEYFERIKINQIQVSCQGEVCLHMAEVKGVERHGEMVFFFPALLRHN